MHVVFAGMRALIAHLDADCFYVSAERVRDGALLHIPAGVLGNQGAVIIAKSYEAKAQGVKTGMPIWDAVKCCPEGVYLKRDFRWYEVLSRQMLELLRTVSPAVEYYSIDEMFFDARELPAVFSLPLLEASQALQRRFLDEIGIPVSMGVSRSRTLAKLVSDTAKPFGCRVLLDTGEIKTFLESQSVVEIAGIGERSRVKLAAHGIQSCGDFARADRLFIRRLLTIKGEGMWWELHGEPVQPILTSRPKHKCLGRGGSLGGQTADLARLNAWLVRNTERLIEELDFHEVLAGHLLLILDYKDESHWAGKVAFDEPTAAIGELLIAAKEMLAGAYHPARPVFRMHLLAEKLADRSAVQRSLFRKMARPAMQQIAETKRAINARLGRFAVRSGDTLALDDIYLDETNGYDICDIRGKICF